MQSEGIATLKGRHWVYCMVLKNFTIIALLGKYTNWSWTLVAIFKKDIATPSQQIQCILLRIHQYWVRILYKPVPELFIADWLSWHNHMEKKDEEINVMHLRVDTIQISLNISECMSIQQIHQATAQDKYLQWLKGHIIAGWPEIKGQVQWDIRAYWAFKNDMAVINGIIMKDRHVITPEILKTQDLDQLHINHMGIEKTKLLACESIYWVNINVDIENFIKDCTTCLTFQQTHPKDNMIHHDIPVRPWDVIGADMFTLNNKHYLCVVDYHSKFPIITKTEHSLILTCKIIFAEYRIPKKIMSDSGGNFISDKFKTFSKSLTIEQAFLSSYYHQSNGQVEACMKFVKCTLKKCFDTRGDPHISLLQIQMILCGQGLSGLTTMLFNCLMRGIMPIINRPLVGIDNNDEHQEMTIKRQTKNDKDKDTSKYFVSIPIGSTVAVQWEDKGPWTHGTIEGKGDQNHHDSSYHICITKTGRLVTWQTTHEANIDISWTIPPGLTT